MTAEQGFDRRLGDWLEDGPQTVPDWLVEAALEQAHATPQLGAGLRMPGLGRTPVTPWGRLASVVVGALAGLAVIGAFVLGLLSAPRLGDQPTPIPIPTPTTSPQPTGPPTSFRPRAVSGMDVVEVLPGETPDFYALIGLTATDDAAWTAVVTEESARLVRIDAATGLARAITIPGAGGLLSPPAADGNVVWTGSSAGLHRVDGSGSGEPERFATAFAPVEIAVSPDGLWVSHEGGISLLDRESGVLLRDITAPTSTARGRIIGAPAFGTLWACGSTGPITRLDATDGTVTETLNLPAGGDCSGRFFPVSGVPGLDDGVIPYLTSAVLRADREPPVEFEVGSWSDIVEVGGRLWFLEIVRDAPAGGLALVELDPATLGPRQTLTFEGTFHLNTATESGYLAVAGDYLWVLADPPGASEGPQIVRIPLAQLSDI